MDDVLLRLIAVIAFGIGAQWIAWRINLPSILLLLLTGIVAGPLTGFMVPDEIFGDLLLPVVSLSVAIILYEGGLSLRLREVRKIGRVVTSLSTVGALVTWLGASAAAWLLFDLPLGLASVLGAVFIVTGPTVVGPMLRHIRPTGRVGPVLKWEGIVTDPIGAVTAVLLFEGLVHPLESVSAGTLHILRIIVLGTVIGAAGAGVFVVLLRYHLLPDFLHNAWSLMLVFVVFGAGQMVQDEVGLLSVTLMGVVLANQRWARIHHIIEFKEDLRVLLISSLFILLAARLDMAHLNAIGWRHIVFVAFLILILRPLTVWVGTLGSSLTTKERVFVACVAPRGIVSAAVASVLALELAERGYEQANLFVPVTFSVIIGTVTVYGLGATYVARALGLSDPNPQGFLILGAHPWARALALMIQSHGVRVRLVDSNRYNIVQARMEGIPVHHGNILAEHELDEVDLSGLGRFLALTPNEDVNARACGQAQEVFGKSNIYQLTEGAADSDSSKLGGRRLFGPEIGFAQIAKLSRQGAGIKATNISEEFTMEDVRSHYGENFIPLLVVAGEGRLEVLSADGRTDARPGETLVSMALSRPDEAATTAN